MQRIYFTLLVIFLTGSFSCSGQNVVLNSRDPHIRYMGRIEMTDSAAVLAWSGTTVTINFKGTGVKTLLKDERGDNYYNVVVDGQVVGKIHPDKGEGEYTLVSGLPAGNHQLELFKRTEWAMGKTWFYKFMLDDKTFALPAPTERKRKLEFFGNSITCGYADEDTTGKDRGTSTYENGYLSYAAITARHFNADFYNTSKSGIGVLVSWFPLIMPEMYDRLDANDPASKWDFTKYTPDIVVINLFQNDSWLVNMPDNPQFKAKFGTTPPTEEQIIKAYRDMVKNIRGKYPKAHIVCALGAMDATKDGSKWPGYIEKAVTQLKDKNIYTHFFPYKNTPGHPSVKEQQVMADDLIAYITRQFNWQ